MSIVRVDDPGNDRPDPDSRPKDGEGDGDDGEAILDYLGALLFDGASVGETVPGISSLYLDAGPTVDRDLLHILDADGERFRVDYLDYLGATRQTHEGWATFASIQVTAHIHADGRSRVRTQARWRIFTGGILQRQ